MKSVFIKASLIATSCVVGIILMEVILRLFFPYTVSFDHPDLFWNHWQDSSMERTKQLALSYNEMGIYDETLGYIDRDVLSGELSFDARSGSRIMLLGDSIMHSPEFSKPILSALRKKYSQDQLDFFNASTPGWDTRQEVTYLENYGLKYKPNLVLFQLCINDFVTTPVFWRSKDGKFLAFNAGKWGQYINSALLSKSELFQRLLVGFLKRFPFDDEMDVEKVRDSLKALADMSRANGFEAHLILVPYLRQPTKKDVRRMILLREITSKFFRPDQVSDFLDLKNEGDMTKWRRAPEDFVHPNVRFSKRAAAQIANKLRIDLFTGSK